MEEKAINSFLLEKNIFDLFCAQLVKDFEGAGADASLLSRLGAKAENVRAIVLEAVKEISKTSSHLIPSLLYRIDIGEKQLSNFRHQNQSLTFEEVMAELIIRRILQKVILKKKFSNG